MNYILGIDIGTGSTKAVAANLDYKPIYSVQYPYPVNQPQSSYQEQDPEQIWDAFVSCLKDVLNQAHQESPVAICLSSAMHSIIPVDKNGLALAPMITWADARASAIATSLKNSELGEEIYRTTGTPIHAMSPLCKLIWYKVNQAELFKYTYKFISIKEYIWYKLFKEFKIDHSIASCTGLFDIHELEWSSDALKLAGISKGKLSDPVPTSYSNKNPTAHTLENINLTNTTFVIGASDGCLANLGTHADAPGVAAVTIGTSGAVRIASSVPIYQPVAMPFSYILDSETYICGGPVNNGGLALQWLLKNVFGKINLGPEDYDELFKNIDTTPAGSEGLFFLPYLTGERAPIWDSESCGTYFGLTLKHQQKHLARALIEGICYALYDVLQHLENEITNIKQLRVSGGFIHSRAWMQILADVMGINLVLVQEEDASAMGAIYLAAKALRLKNYKPTAQQPSPVVIEPQEANHQLYKSNFLIYRQLYGQLKTSMHQIYHLKN